MEQERITQLKELREKKEAAFKLWTAFCDEFNRELLKEKDYLEFITRGPVKDVPDWLEYVDSDRYEKYLRMTGKRKATGKQKAMAIVEQYLQGTQEVKDVSNREQIRFTKPKRGW